MKANTGLTYLLALFVVIGTGLCDSTTSIIHVWEAANAKSIEQQHTFGPHTLTTILKAQRNPDRQWVIYANNPFPCPASLELQVGGQIIACERDFLHAKTRQPIELATLSQMPERVELEYTMYSTEASAMTFMNNI
ncbi:hypothetical protein PGT21_028986 [Puccinia graminis f. sp. tritici]|uniref:Uncharacterized protein n=1 Tax=Puccinia graminis f. sp. tritici TaxID=56615 RepID=A0A5B0QC55_PUCGR|nr:hypothetical protein PGTUg99_017309 [Puccinia graminis f. sp. tritici]KAA1091168.1 hypothetical protein PGT21_027564 [Puccinia graminis f. sp. tritici]KAA1110662.1 hypothetical protein PGT21_028986 [Puccinia graminis f. sp. tritici]KAA1139280.1 hypothetical protein PGTUg99_037635 [Puccinia graminis f. sp. tritici]